MSFRHSLPPGRLAALALLLASAGGCTAHAAQQVRTVADDPWCDRDYSGDRESYCEVREIALAADREVIAVNARPNGGIRVEGWNRNEIQVRAKVQAHAESERRAREIADAIRIDASGRTIEAEGPRTGRREGWAVSYRLSVPARSNLDLESVNGGISIEAVSGKIDFRTTNGGVTLSRLEGDVKGRTTNGGVDIELSGSEWTGTGMDVRTTNGGLKIALPEGYSAHLETGTVNGPLRVDFPITVQGRIDRRIEVDLGRGGKTIRAMTTNGGVVIRRI